MRSFVCSVQLKFSSVVFKARIIQSINERGKLKYSSSFVLNLEIRIKICSHFFKNNFN